MPAWPTQQRDDEVWAMVAFLRTLPDLQAEDYRRLVHGETSPTSDDTPRRGLLGPEQVPRAVTASCTLPLIHAAFGVRMRFPASPPAHHPARRSPPFTG